MWEDDPKVSAEFKRRWPNATENQAARQMANEMFGADAMIRFERGLMPDPLPLALRRFNHPENASDARIP